jgi:hypothetical protein
MEGRVDHFVRLDRLPERLIFPSEQEGKIGYDAAVKRLWYRGFMSKAAFDRLYLLSEDWGYRRALEELFQLSTPEDEPPRRAARALTTVLATLGILLGAAFVWLLRGQFP